MQRRKHQQLLGRWLNFTKPGEVILLSESALEAPTHAASAGNQSRRGRLNSTNSNRDGECLDASFSLNDDTSDAWEHPLASNASASSVHDAHSVCLSTTSSVRLSKSSSLSPSKRATTSPGKGSHSPIKGSAQDQLFPRSTRHSGAKSSKADRPRDRCDNSSGYADVGAAKRSKDAPRSETEPLSNTFVERSPSVAPAVSPIESLSFMIREIDLNESILKDDGSTTLPSSPIVSVRKGAQASHPFPIAGSGVGDDEFQMSFAVHELLSDDGPDVEVFKKVESSKATRRVWTGAALEQSFESSGGGIDEFVAIKSPQHHETSKDSQGGCYSPSRTEQRRRQGDYSRQMHPLDQRGTNGGKPEIETLLRSPGGTSALDRTTSWNDTLDDGIKFRRVANGNPHFYDEFSTMYAQDEAAVPTVHDISAVTAIAHHHKSMNFDELHGEGRCVEPHNRLNSTSRVPGRGSPPLSVRTTFDEEEEQENELVRFAIEQSLNESGAVSYQNDFLDGSSVSTSHNIASKHSERSCSESFSHDTSFSTQRRSIFGPEDVSITEDQEREMIEIALERSLQDSRASQSHASISSRGGSISTTHTLDSTENHNFYPGAKSGSSHSRTSMSGASSHSRRSLSASPKPHALAPQTLISPRQMVGNNSHESALLLMLDDDDYDEDELLAPASLTPSHVSVDRRSGWSDTCSAHRRSQQHPMSPPARFPFSPHSRQQRPSFDRPSCSSSCSLDGRSRSSSSSFDGGDRPRYRWELELPMSSQRIASPFDTYSHEDEEYGDLGGGRSHAVLLLHGDGGRPGNDATHRSVQNSPDSWNRVRSQSYHRDSRIAASISGECHHGGRSAERRSGQLELEETDNERADRMERELVELAMQRSMSEL